MTPKFLRWFSVVALTLASTAFAQTTPPASTIPTLRIQDYPGMIGTLLHVAIEKGYCAKQGIQCTLQVIPSAPLGMQTLLAGGIDASLGNAEVAIQAMEKGADIKIVSGAATPNVFVLTVSTRLGAGADKKYPEIMHGLKGRKVGVTARGSAAEFQLRDMLSGAGMQPDDVTYVAVGGANTAYPAMINGQVDAVEAFPPFDGFCDVLKTCKIAVQPWKGEGPSTLTVLGGGSSALITMRREFIAKNPKTVDAFIKALQDAGRFIADPANSAELLKITLKYFQIDMPQGDAIVENTLMRWRTGFSTEVTKKGVQATADYMLKNKQIDKPFDASRLF